MHLGLIHLYTGDGKGKTTAAWGLVLRAAGQGLRCCVVQFMKSCPQGGEARAWRQWLRQAGVELRQFARQAKEGERWAWVDPKNVLPEDRAAAEEGLAYARQAVNSGQFDLVVLDEIAVAVDWGLLEEERILQLLRERPRGVEMVLTGRGASARLVAAADLVTEMKAVKHPMDSGVRARAGIEY